MSRPYIEGSVGPGTLEEELAKRGYSHRHNDYTARTWRHDITRNGRTVTVQDAHSCWSWLARLDRKLRALGGAR